MPHQQEDIEAREPNLPPSDHHVTVGNLLVIDSYMYIKQHMQEHDGWDNNYCTQVLWQETPSPRSKPEIVVSIYNFDSKLSYDSYL